MPEQADISGMGSDQDLPDTLYHYTDINGLQGIWEKGHLWATGFRFLNDTSELRLGMILLKSKVARRQVELYEENLETVQRELELRKDEQPVNDAFFATLKAKNAPELSELEEISAAAEDAEKYMHSHIACLSERDDQLSQWRAYAREGYCVGFDTKLLLESLNDDQVMRRVHYYDETANEAYASPIIEIAKQHRRVMLEHPDLADFDEEGRKWIMARRMTVHASFVKDTGFSEEKEVRIVEINGTADCFTPNRYGMVPRIFIPLPDGCIRSVTIGPTAHKDLKLRSMFDYFWAVRFKNRDGRPPKGELIPTLRNSRIPFRDW
jgi:Arc/MetJ family transcription regulator